MTILEALQGVSAYPIPTRTIWREAAEFGLDLQAEADADFISSKEFRLTTAGLLLWLSSAPNISQGGQSYSFSEDQRKAFRNQAAAIKDEYDEDIAGVAVQYGYKGSRL